MNVMMMITSRMTPCTALYYTVLYKDTHCINPYHFSFNILAYGPTFSNIKKILQDYVYKMI